MAEQKITVEIEGNHTFEFSADVNPAGGDVPLIFDHSYVVEEREGDSLTIHPVSRVTAVYVGSVPSRSVGFPTIPSP